MRLILLVIVLLFLRFPGYSQKTETIHLLKYSQKHGLPSYNVRKVVQDKYGFIWVGTQDGVSRFDGRTFLNYSKSASHKNKICGVDVRELIEDTVRNLLWVLPGEVGINAINTLTGEVVLTAPFPTNGIEEWNISMLKDNDVLWIGTFTGVKAYNISKNKYEEGLPLPERATSSTNFETRSLIKDEYGNIWACYSGYGIVVYDGKTKKIIKELSISELNDHNKSNDIRFYSYTALKPGEVLFATSQGLRKISYSSSYQFNIDVAPCKSIPVLNTASIDCVAPATQNEILIAGYNRLFRFDRNFKTSTNFEEPARIGETDWLNAVQNIYTDREHNLWLGCQEGLSFISKSPSPFIPYTYDKHTNTKLEHVRSLYPLDNGDILVGLRNGIVNIKSSNNLYKKYDTGYLYHHIFQDKSELIHVSRPDGMFIFSNGNLSPISKFYPEFTPYASSAINSHLFISDTMIILGTESDDGILLWNPSKKTVRQITQTSGNGLLSSNIVNNIYKAQNGNIWVLSDKVITILTPDLSKSKKFIPVEIETGLPYNLFFDMCEASGYYWIVSYGAGILQLDSALNIRNVLNTEKGMSNDGVYQIYNIQNKNILVTTNNGLSLIDPNNYKVKTYFVNNGLHANGFEEVAGTNKNEKIYAGGVNGFTIINPQYFSGNTTLPILYINNVQIKTKTALFDTCNLSMKELKIPSNTLQTVINFSALNYLNPERTTIAYKIKEQHSDWINIGNKNSLPLIGFSPGTYHLQLKAINEDGLESNIKDLTLIYLPKWYQTSAFKILLLLIIAAIFYGLYRFRINHLKKEEKIRNQVAADLHDELGSTLNSVKVYTNLAMIEKDNISHLEKIKEATQSAISGVKDIIWVLDDKRDTLDHLLGRINQFAKPLCEAAGITYNQQSGGNESHKLGKEEKRNLYMIIKESINNSIKYADCTSIELLIKNKGGKLSIAISDNGKGFDKEKMTSGYGLKNILHRSEEIAYKVEINSSPGKGTLIYLEKR